MPDDRASTDLDEDFGQIGFRMPAVAISPWSRNAQRTAGRFGWWFNERWRVDHGQYAHESILSFISYRFELGYLNKRHEYGEQHRARLRLVAPGLEPAELPDPPAILTQPCALGGGDVQDYPGGARERPRRPRGVRRAAQGPGLRRQAATMFTKPDTMKKEIEAAP